MGSMQSFEERFREARAKTGLTQDELAIKTGISRRQISFYENGHAKPSLDAAVLLAETLGVSVDFLAGHIVTDVQHRSEPETA